MSDPFDLAAESSVHTRALVMNYIRDEVPPIARTSALACAIDGLVAEMVEELSSGTWQPISLQATENAMQGTDGPAIVWNNLFNSILAQWETSVDRAFTKED